MFRLPLEVADSPELYDFRFGSGVVRDEEGVEIFRGSMDGERELGRKSADNGGGFGNDGVGVVP